MVPSFLVLKSLSGITRDPEEEEEEERDWRTFVILKSSPPLQSSVFWMEPLVTHAVNCREQGVT